MTVTYLHSRTTPDNPPPATPHPRPAALLPAAARSPQFMVPYNGLGRRRAVFNSKGGVVKTGTIVALAAALARRRRRVLVLDFDKQGNATRRLGVTPAMFGPAGDIGTVLATPERGAAVGAIVPCGWDSPEADWIDVIPATITLGQRELEAHLAGADNRLRRVLYADEITDGYDYVLIDTSPSLGMLERMVTRCLDGEDDGFLVPVEAHQDAIGAAVRCVEQVYEWADVMDMTRPAALGVIVSLYERALVLHRGRVGPEDRDHPDTDAGAGALGMSLPDIAGAAPPVLRPYIPRNAHLSEVHDAGAPVSPIDPRLVAEGIIARYDALAKVIDQ